MNVIGRIDVSWRGKVVALDGLGGEIAEAGVRNVDPGRACEQQRVETDASVGRGQERGVSSAPRGDDPIDRPWIEIRAVAEDDDRRVHLRAESSEPAAKRGARTALPVRTLDRACIRLDLVRTEDDDDVVHGAGVDALQHGLEQQPLLRRAEAGGSARREDNGCDHARWRRGCAADVRNRSSR